MYCHINVIRVPYVVPPMMWVPAQQISVYYGDDATLVCMVEAHPEALVYWEFNGQMIQEVGGIQMRQLRGPPKYKVMGANPVGHLHPEPPQWYF